LRSYPLNEYHEPDLSYITSTIEAIAPRLRQGQLIVLESTTYREPPMKLSFPFGERQLVGLKANRTDSPGDFYVAFSPEREDPGNTTVARRDIPKVVGGLEPTARNLPAPCMEPSLIGPCGLQSVGGGADQASGKYLPLRKHSAGQ